MPTWPHELITIRPRSYQIETSCVFVHMLIRHDLALQLRRGEMTHVAADPVLHPEFDQSVGQHFFNAAAFDLAGGEGLVVDDRRRLGKD